MHAIIERHGGISVQVADTSCSNPCSTFVLMRKIESRPIPGQEGSPEAKDQPQGKGEGQAPQLRDPGLQ